jgi:hypothetical protein
MDLARAAPASPRCLALIIGSNEQRDVFQEQFIAALLLAGRWDEARRALTRRHKERPMPHLEVLLRGVDIVL